MKSLQADRFRPHLVTGGQTTCAPTYFICAHARSHQWRLAAAELFTVGRTLTDQRQQWHSHVWTPKSTRTFDEVADHWLTLRGADSSIGPNTIRADRESLAYARRAFGAVHIQKLTP